MTKTNSPSTYGEYSDQMTDELDEYGVWVKSSPQSLDEPETLVLSKEDDPPQGLPELSGKPSQTDLSEGNAFPADLLKGFLMDIEDVDATGQKAETETPDIPSISPALLSEPIETVAAIPMDSEQVNTEKAAIMESQNIHADLLGRISDELVSIHDELTGIREELSRSVAVLTSEMPKSSDLALIRDELTGIREELSQTIVKPVPEVDDDDKRIVLTGDELSDIFNTARHSHQDSEDSSEESPDNSSAEETLPELNLISNISLDETLLDFDDGYLHIIKDANTDEMKKPYEEGITPLTPAPEDTSYLEMQPFDTPDLFNVVIEDHVFADEPEKIEEHPLEEPSPEHIKNLSLGIIDTTIDAEHSDEPLDEPLIEGLLINDDSTNDLSIELDKDHLHAAYYQEEDEILELEEYEDEESEVDQDFGDLLMTENWGDAAEETSSDTPRTDKSPSETEPHEEPEKKSIDRDLSETSVSHPKEPYDKVTSYLTHELKRILAYMDRVLDSLPDDKIEMFTQSEHFTTYKQIFKTLGLS